MTITDAIPPPVARQFGRVRAYSRGEVIADGVVHAVALLAGAAAFAVLITLVALTRENVDLTATVIYAAAILLMLAFSAAYNLTPMSPAKMFLRRLDHVGIFLAIAGTYTPLIVQFEDQSWTWILGLTVWSGAVLGAVLKLVAPKRTERLSTVVYLALAWVAVIAIRPMMESFTPATMALIAAGGVLYTGGVVFHLWRGLKYQNAIWHGFVLVAASCHYAAVTSAMLAGAPDL